MIIRIEDTELINMLSMCRSEVQMNGNKIFLE